MNFEQIGTISGALVSVLSALGIFYRFAVKPIRDKLNQIDELGPAVARIKQEVTPSGGGSLKDSVGRIEESVATTKRRLEDTSAKLESLNNSIHAHGHRLRASLRQAATAMFETDNEGRFLWVNDEYIRLSGRSKDDVLGANWINSVIPDERDGVLNEWTAAAKHGRDFDMEFTLWTQDGRQIEVRGRAECIRATSGKVMGFQGQIIAKAKG